MSKILLIVPEFPPNHIGGGGVIFEGLANSYKELGHELLIITGDHTKKNIFGRIKIQNINSINIVKVPEIYTPISLLHTVMPIPFWCNSSLKRMIKRFSPDFIHIHGYGLFMPAQLGKICKKLGFNYTFTIHGAPVSPEKMKNPVISWAYKFYHRYYGFPLLDNASRITAVSSYAKNFEIFQNYTSKIEVIGNGLDLKDYYEVTNDIFIEKGIKKNKNTVMILSLGRIEWIKGFEKIINLIPEMLKNGYDVRYVIAGRDNGEKQNLIQLAEKLGVKNHLHFLGFIETDEKMSALNHCDLVAIPSETESYGLVGLEARVFKKSVITTFAGGLKDALKGYNGAFHLADYEKALNHETNKDDDLEEFTWKNITNKYLNT